MLFFEDLNRKLNPKNKLYKLRGLINWSELEENVSPLVNVSDLGHTRKSLRVMLGVSMLQAMYNFSDSLSSEELQEKLYWQYFCGYNYSDHDIKISEASIRRFRNILGDEGYNMILQELAKVGLKVGAYSDFLRIIKNPNHKAYHWTKKPIKWYIIYVVIKL
jgi:IS5 family transposase